ncbi:10168_t:CDS:2 [Funneliformis geosporum]|uniref:10168_t:CDS:1 n=1 Tax=Funneliformis geosporum TaxID=1117311 RepID=A0A9W4SRM8_9GLOM|nr:10168_t:CDS:2 [Funneliformis geosporum]
MALIHSNFDFLNRPWWRPDYDDRVHQYFISNTTRLQQAILLSVNNEDELFWEGFMELHRERYLIECISAEGNVDIDDIKQLLKKSWFKLKKIQNLHDTINGIFPSIFFLNLPMDRFTPLLAQQLHQQVGNGLIDNAGRYRTRYVMAAQENYVYLAPNLIGDRMEELFRQCRVRFGVEELELDDAIKFGACFLSHFLYIHPFMNGNGSVARLLLSYLLSRFTVVPLSLYTGTRTRDIYLQCLRESRYHKSFMPNALATFILENVYTTSHNICAVMDINVPNNV